MRRSMLLLLPLVVLALLITSCRDRSSPTKPDAEPSYGKYEGEQDPAAEAIQDLIVALYPTPGLEKAALNIWANIQRKLADGLTEDAQAQARALVGQLSDAFSEDLLAAPLAPLPTTVEGAVSELVTRLYAFVGMTHSVLPEDFGFGDIDPGEAGTIETVHGWAAVIVGADATDPDGEPIHVTIELLDQARCALADPLVQALGCWDINRYPEGEWEEDVKVEICVADTDPPSMSDEEWDLLLLHHKSDDGEVTPLPWAEPTVVDCTGFDVGAAQQTASRGPLGSLFASVGSRVADLLLPEPLAAKAFFGAHPPTGIGGMAGTFSEFFAAVPEGARPHLVAWWPGDGSSVDMYRHSQVVSTSGDVSFGEPAMFGSAFQFGHGGEVWIDNISPEVEALQQLTVSTWVYLDSAGPADGVQRFVSLGNEQAVLRQEGGGNRTLHFYMGIDGGLRHIWVDNALLTGCYHHVAGSYDGSTMRLYLDGQEVGTNSVDSPGEVTGGSSWARFGSDPANLDTYEPLWGSLDEVMVFDKALDPSDIQAMYDAGGAGRCPATRATGNIGFTRDDIWRTFAFNAWPEADGTAHGHFEWSYPPPEGTVGPWNHGEGYVTCMTMEGNEAWLGGVITYHATHPEYEGLEAVFRVADNTQSEGTDQMSLLQPLLPPASPEDPTAQVFCTTMPEWPPLIDIEWGDVIVRY